MLKQFFLEVPNAYAGITRAIFIIWFLYFNKAWKIATGKTG